MPEHTHIVNLKKKKKERHKETNPRPERSVSNEVNPPVGDRKHALSGSSVRNATEGELIWFIVQPNTIVSEEDLLCFNKKKEKL